MTPEHALPEHFGLAGFREPQRAIVESVLAHKDTLVVMPTGGGKSLCFQLPAMMLPGVTLVVSPLIALMKDQVDALQAKGLPAGLLNSSLSLDEQRAMLDAIRRKELKLVYVAPERFRSQSFLNALPRMRSASLPSTRHTVFPNGATISAPTICGSVKRAPPSVTHPALH